MLRYTRSILFVLGLPLLCCGGTSSGGDGGDGGSRDGGTLHAGDRCDPAHNLCADGLRCCYIMRPITGAMPVCATPEQTCNPP